MIKHFTLIFVCLCTLSAFSQDVIITQAGDSIKCKIDEESPVLFLYSQQKKNGAIVRSQIFKNNVKAFRYNYKTEVRSGSDKNVVKFSTADDEGIDRRAYRNYMRYQLGIKVGSFFGNQRIPIGNLPEDYARKFKNGTLFGIQTCYFLNDNFGLGIQYNAYSQRSQRSDSDFLDFDEKPQRGKLKDVATLRNLALSGHYRRYLNYKMLVLVNAELGYGFYRNETTRALEKGKFKAGGMFYRPSIGFDYLIGNDVIGRDLSLGLELGYSSGSLGVQTYQSSQNQVSYTLPATKNLGRMDISLTLKFYKFPKYLKLTSL